MALSGQIFNTYRTGYRIRVDWQAIQDINNNRSTIYLDLFLESLGSSYTISSSDGKPTMMLANGTAWVNTGEVNVSLSGNQTKYLLSYSETVNHDTNGNWSGEIGGFIDFQGLMGYNGVYCSQVVSLDNIPRNSTLASPNPPNFTVTNDITVTINKYIPSSTHTIQLWVEKTTANQWELIAEMGWGTGTTSGTFGLDTGHHTLIFSTLAQRTSARSMIRVKTYNGGSQVGGDFDTMGTVSIPAPTVPSIPDGWFYIGDSVTISLPRNHASFTHTVKWGFGANEWTIGTGAGASLVWNSATQAATMYATIPNNQYGNGGFTVTTFYNGVQVGTPKNQTSQWIIAYCKESICKPAFDTADYYDINATTTGLTLDASYIIQNKSKLRVRVVNLEKAVAQNAATMSKYIAEVAGRSITVNTPFATDIYFDFDEVNASVNQTVSVKAYDSRGFFTEVKLTVKVIPYSEPVVISTAVRQSGFLASTSITVSGSISSLNRNGSNLNSIKTPASSTGYRYRTLPSGAWSSWALFAGLQYNPFPSYDTGVSPAVVSLATASAYEVQVQVTDQLVTKTVTLTVPIGVPLFFIDSVMKNIGIGRFPSSGYALDITGNVRLSGSLTIGSDTISAVPVGTVVPYAGATAPTGWLMCDGTAVSRTTYATLWGILSTTYGSGDGSTTFNVPNLKGRTPVGYDSAQTEFNTRGKTGGAKTHTLTVNEMPSHKHAATEFGGYYAFGGNVGNPAEGAGYGTQLNSLNTGAQGGGQAHNNLQPYIALNYIIKA